MSPTQPSEATAPATTNRPEPLVRPSNMRSAFALADHRTAQAKETAKVAAAPTGAEAIAAVRRPEAAPMAATAARRSAPG